LPRAQLIAYERELFRLIENPRTRYSAHADKLGRKLHQHGSAWFQRMLNHPDNRIPTNRGGRPRRRAAPRPAGSA
jgi:hypothetical protein